MFKLVISDTLVIPVVGVTQADGKETPFSFDLLCHRSTADEIKADLKPNDEDDEVSLVAFMASRVTGWRGVMDPDGKALDFNDATLSDLLKFPGIASLAVNSYIKHCGAKGKEKNSQR